MEAKVTLKQTKDCADRTVVIDSKYSNTKFYIDYAKKVVVARLEYDTAPLIEKLLCICYIRYSDDFIKSLTKKVVFTGIARCNDEDCFSEVIGKKLAYLRALTKLRNYKISLIRTYSNKTLNQKANMFNTVLQRHLKKLDKTECELIDYTDRVNH